MPLNSPIISSDMLNGSYPLGVPSSKKSDNAEGGFSFVLRNSRGDDNLADKAVGESGEQRNSRYRYANILEQKNSIDESYNNAKRQDKELFPVTSNGDYQTEAKIAISEKSNTDSNTSNENASSVVKKYQESSNIKSSNSESEKTTAQSSQAQAYSSKKISALGDDSAQSSAKLGEQSSSIISDNEDKSESELSNISVDSTYVVTTVQQSFVLASDAEQASGDVSDNIINQADLVGSNIVKVGSFDNKEHIQLVHGENQVYKVGERHSVPEQIVGLSGVSVNNMDNVSDDHNKVVQASSEQSAGLRAAEFLVQEPLNYTVSPIKFDGLSGNSIHNIDNTNALLQVQASSDQPTGLMASESYDHKPSNYIVKTIEQSSLLGQSVAKDESNQVNIVGTMDGLSASVASLDDIIQSAEITASVTNDNQYEPNKKIEDIATPTNLNAKANKDKVDGLHAINEIELAEANNQTKINASLNNSVDLRGNDIIIAEKKTNYSANTVENNNDKNNTAKPSNSQVAQPDLVKTSANISNIVNELPIVQSNGSQEDLLSNSDIAIQIVEVDLHQDNVTGKAGLEKNPADAINNNNPQVSQNALQTKDNLSANVLDADLANKSSNNDITAQANFDLAGQKSSTSPNDVAEKPVTQDAKGSSISIAGTIEQPVTFATASSNGVISVKHAALASPVASAVSIPEQAVFHLRRQIKEGVETMTLQLEPADLGRVDVRLMFGADGQVKASFFADQSATLGLLRDSSDTLRAALTNAGLNPDNNSIDFGFRNSNNNGYQQQNLSRQMNEERWNGNEHRTPAWNLDDSSIVSDSPLANTTTSSGRLNIRI